MKNTIHLLIAFGIAMLTTTAVAQKPHFETYYEYTVSMQSQDHEAFETDWHTALTPSRHERFVSQIIDAFLTSDSNAYYADSYPDRFRGPEEKYWQRIPLSQRPKLLNEIQLEYGVDMFGEPVYTEYGDPRMDSVFIPYRLLDYTSIGFLEKWSVSGNTIQKTVVGITLNVPAMDMNGDSVGEKPLFYLKMNTPDTRWTNKKTLVQRSLRTKVPLNYTAENETLEWWESGLETSKRYEWWSNWIKDMKSGKLEVNHPRHPFSQTMSVDSTKSALVNISEVWAFDSYGDQMFDEWTGEPKTRQDTVDTWFELIDYVEFVEDWHFDPKKLYFQKTVYGVIPYQPNFDISGDVNAWSPICFVPTNGLQISTSAEDIIRIPRIEYNNYVSAVALPNGYKPPYRSDGLPVDSLGDTWLKAMSDLLNSVKSGQMEYYEVSPFDTLSRANPLPKKTPYSNRAVSSRQIQYRYDEFGEYLLDPFGDLVMDTVYEEFTAEDIWSITFNETWTYQLNDNTFNKIVKGYVPSVWEDSEESELRYPRMLFYNAPAPLSEGQGKLVGENLRSLVRIRDEGKERPFTPGTGKYAPGYGAWWYSNIDPDLRNDWIGTILNKLQSGKLKAYANHTDTKPLQKQQISERLLKLDSILTDEINEDYTFIHRVFSEPVTAADINYVEFVENWYIDEKTFAIRKEVVGMYLLSMNFDPNSNDRVKRPLEPIVYVKFN